MALIKDRIDELDFPKLKTCSLKDREFKDKPIDWEKIFANHIFDEELLSRIYKEHSNLNHNK